MDAVSKGMTQPVDETDLGVIWYSMNSPERQTNWRLKEMKHIWAKNIATTSALNL